MRHAAAHGITHSVNSLDELLNLPPAERKVKLGQPGTQDAIKALGTEAGIAWLEAHIESPVGSEWGIALLRLEPAWFHLDRWFRLSKLHCLAAMDVLFRHTEPYGNGEERRMPEGADATSINEAIDFALANYSNPRLEKAAKEIRRTWPRGKQKRHSVSVPDALTEAADIVLCHDARWVKDWHQVLAKSKDVADTPYKLWDSLLSFATSKNCVAIVDWKECRENILVSLRALKSAENLTIEWDAFNEVHDESDDLLRAVGKRVAGHGTTLLCLDHGCDDYPLTFVATESALRLVASIASFRDAAMRVILFGTDTA